MKQLPSAKIKDILEIGCGTGSLTEEIASKLSPDRLVAIDISSGMLSMAVKRIGRRCGKIHLVCSDGENIALRPGTRFDLLVSASTMQWFKDLGSSVHLLCHEYLEENGLLVAAFFGKNTLKELSLAISDAFADREVLLPPELFPEFSSLFGMFGCLFTHLEIRRKVIVKEYQGLLQLLRHLKMTGVSPGGRPPLLTSPGALSRLERCYLERFGTIRAGFEIIFMKGRKR